MGTGVRRGTVRVYCAGPLFNQKEKDEMQELADGLKAAGFDTFLPQRDGLELTACVDALVSGGMERTPAGVLASQAIFALDVFQVLEHCQALVANLNGRVPDEGAVAEAAMAWACGKTVIGYKADSRTAFGGEDNPLVAGLFEFRLARSLPDAVEALSVALGTPQALNRQNYRCQEEIKLYIRRGQEIWHALRESRNIGTVAQLIRSYAEGPASQVRL